MCVRVVCLQSWERFTRGCEVSSGTRWQDWRKLRLRMTRNGPQLSPPPILFSAASLQRQSLRWNRRWFLRSGAVDASNLRPFPGPLWGISYQPAYAPVRESLMEGKKQRFPSADYSSRKNDTNYRWGNTLLDWGFIEWSRDVILSHNGKWETPVEGCYWADRDYMIVRLSGEKHVHVGDDVWRRWITPWFTRF